MIGRTAHTGSRSRRFGGVRVNTTINPLRAACRPARLAAMRALCLRSLAVVVATVVQVGPALAAEPPGVGKVVRAADKATTEQALQAAGLTERCKGALARPDLLGLHCRLAVAQTAGAKPLVKVADVDARAAFVTDALGAADHIAGYAPSAPEPGMRRTRFEAHKLACNIAFSAVNDFESMSGDLPGAARARVLIAGVSTTKALPPVGLRDAACGCAQRSVDLAVGADASPDEQTAVQGVLTRNRCLLAGDKLRIADRTDPGRALKTGTEAFRSVAEASSPAGLMVELARGHLVEMTRCTDKHVDGKKVKDKLKLSTCACGVAKRWALPLKKDDPKVQARLPILEGEQLFLPVTVEANEITACGDVDGPLLAP